MPDPEFKTIPIPGTGLRERMIVNEDGSLSRPTEATFADSSGLNAETTQAAFKSANHTDLSALATLATSLNSKVDSILTKLDTIISNQ